MKCRLFHDWDWVEEIPGHTWGCPMTGTCQRCGKIKYIPYVNWGDPKHRGARLRVPLEVHTGPPPPPRARMPLYPPLGSLRADQEGGRGSDAPLSPTSLLIYSDRTRRQFADGTYSLRYKGAAFGRGPKPTRPPPPAPRPPVRRPDTTTKVGF
jgi:hypothetical protein